MRIVRIIEPGPSATVQDLGRHGHAAVGVSASGAADRLSLRIANRLLGNPDGSAAIEAAMLGPTIEAVDHPITLAIAGASVHATIRTPTGSRPAPMWRAIVLPAGARLVVGPVTLGCRVCVAFAGGIDTPPTLGSRSAHLSTAIGGPPLHAAQTLPLGPAARTQPGNPFDGPASRDMLDLIRSLHAPRLRITLAPENAEYPHWPNGPDGPAGPGTLFGQPFIVELDSDRVGIRLRHTDPPSHAANANAPSEATMFGTIQATPEQLIILGPDAAPTGGYPSVGTVIAADLDALGQKRPGDAITLHPISHQDAWQRWREREARLDALLPPNASPTNNPA